ncbi:TetR family transcriptional regulator [Cellulomonas sp. JZ18]|uniref:TetR/AcrR family transcriptional regulator n=1 Tax=Cellulomonas sp. JZ18 TaxID=2654191 RepID=UPI0012D49776|nr:TetR/AcrR family transcriptional regulator [Cellulomonas sp. JZ18]QGQ18311.1 TetR family transcriptional regulator [Cellulomonas sp. JZ18]
MSDQDVAAPADGRADGPDAPLSARRQRTRERLLDAAFDLFAEDGVDATSIETVCERAGFTRGAFYSNFASKHELLLALAGREQARHLAELREGIAAASAQGLPGADLDVADVGRFVAALLDRISDDRRWRVVSTELRLLALRQPAVAGGYLELEGQMVAECAAEVERLAAHVGRRFVVDARQVLLLVAEGYEADRRTAELAGGTVRAQDLAARWLPTVVERLTVPADQRA